jgi:hypothetical protein
MATTIPENLNLSEVEEIRNNREHPLHNAYRNGDEKLIERVDQAYRRRYGSGQEESSSPEQISREHAELKQKYQNVSNPKEIPAELMEKVPEEMREEIRDNHNQLLELADQEWGQEASQKFELANQRAIEIFGDEAALGRYLYKNNYHLNPRKHIKAVKLLLDEE